MKFTKVGMRTIKTVIAVILSLAIGELFNLRSPLLASFGAIMTMESSISESFEAGKNRIFGTIIGGLVALLIISLAPENYFFLGLGLIIIINVCNTFKWEKASRMGMVVFLIIVLDYSAGDGAYYIFHRTLDTLFGVVMGTAVNYFIRPPDIEKRLFKTLENMYNSTKKTLEEQIWKKEFEEMEELKEEIISVGEDYKIFEQDLKFHLVKSENGDLYREIFDSFEKIQVHSAVIESLKDQPRINESNKALIEEFFRREIPIQDGEELDKLDFVYNYHLKRILNKLISIDNKINKAHDPQVD